MFEKLRIVTQEKIYDSFILLGIIRIHQTYFEVSPFLLKYFDSCKMHNHERQRSLKKTNLSSIIFVEKRSQNSSEIKIAINSSFKVLFKDKRCFKSFNYQADGIPFDISLVFIGIIWKKDTIFKHIYKNRLNLEFNDLWNYSPFLFFDFWFLNSLFLFDHCTCSWKLSSVFWLLNIDSWPWTLNWFHRKINTWPIIGDNSWVPIYRFSSDNHTLL